MKTGIVGLTVTRTKDGGYIVPPELVDSLHDILDYGKIYSPFGRVMSKAIKGSKDVKQGLDLIMKGDSITLQVNLHINISIDDSLLISPFGNIMKEAIKGKNGTT